MSLSLSHLQTEASNPNGPCVLEVSKVGQQHQEPDSYKYQINGHLGEFFWQ